MGYLVPSEQPAPWLEFLLGLFLEGLARHSLFHALETADRSLFEHLIIWKPAVALCSHLHGSGFSW